MREMFDVIVIGAGPAGSLCSLLLKQRGLDVMLVEQHRFPRDKVCGECLSVLGVEVLARHGLLELLLQRGARWLERADVHGVEGGRLQVRFSRPMLGASRSLFDGFLMETARNAGVQLLQPARCEGIDGGNKATARIRDLHSNAVRDWTASCVVVGDGKSALLGEPPGLSGDLGIKAHWEGITRPRHTISLFGFDWGYGGYSPIENDRWNTAFSVSASSLRECRGDIDLLFERMRAVQPTLRESMTGARRITDWMASPLPRFSVRRNWPDNVIPIGNAAAAIEPIGGEGMGLALRSAELATEAIASINDRALRMKQLSNSYKNLWRGREELCRAGAWVIKSHWLSPALFDWLDGNERFFNAVLRGMGK